MTDAFVCNRCDDVETYSSRVSEYELPNRVVDLHASEDAIDIRGIGHLCEDCSREFAEWVEGGGE